MQKELAIYSEIQIPVFSHGQELWAISNMDSYTFIEEVLFVGVSLKMLPVGEYDEPLLIVVSRRDKEVLRMPLKTVFKNRQDAYEALYSGELEMLDLVEEVKASNVVAFSAK